MFFPWQNAWIIIILIDPAIKFDSFLGMKENFNFLQAEQQ